MIYDLDGDGLADEAFEAPVIFGPMMRDYKVFEMYDSSMFKHYVHPSFAARPYERLIKHGIKAMNQEQRDSFHS